MTFDKTVNLLKPQFLPLSSGKNNNTCSDRVIVRNQGDNLCPEFILERVTGVESFVFGVISTGVGGQDLGLPCPLWPAPIPSCPLLGMATSHQRLPTWV